MRGGKGVGGARGEREGKTDEYGGSGRERNKGEGGKEGGAGEKGG